MIYQVRIQFDGHHPLGALQQFLRQRAAAGADLDDKLLVLRTHRRSDAFQYGALNQEVLP